DALPRSNLLAKVVQTKQSAKQIRSNLYAAAALRSRFLPRRLVKWRDEVGNIGHLRPVWRFVRSVFAGLDIALHSAARSVAPPFLNCAR
ncbi:hypothetical protein, partial [Alloprevotella tannerae]